MVKKKHKQDKSVEIVRWSILGTIGLIITVFMVYAVLYTLGVFDTGQRYTTLPNREVQTDEIEVIEFFSYECIACQRLESRLIQFEENLPENVKFSRVHVAFSAQGRRLAAMHVALQLSGALDQNHDRIFLEAAKNNNTFSSMDKIGDFLDGHGITKARFVNLYQGNRVQQLVDRNNEIARELGILYTPSLFVANKYVLFRDDPPFMMQTLRQLIKDIRAGRLPLPEETAPFDADVEQTDEKVPVEEDMDSASHDPTVTPEQTEREILEESDASMESESSE